LKLGSLEKSPIGLIEGQSKMSDRSREERKNFRNIKRKGRQLKTRKKYEKVMTEQENSHAKRET